MRERALQGAAGTLPDEASTRPRGRWRALVPAFIVSLAGHLLLLAVMPLASERNAVRSDPTVSFSAVIVSPAPAPALPAAQPAPALAPQPAPEPEPGAAVPAQPPAARERPRPPAPRVPEYVPADQLAQPPAPLDTPLAAAPVRDLVGRRLDVTVWVRPDGTVGRAEVRRNEIPEEVALQLEEAIARTRFAPGRAQAGGSSVGTVFASKLCFDEAGVLAAEDPECWRPVDPQR